eukprot:m.179769 g.179769  ORF g.179769 m.179769 type:complete len:556 (+) comp39230_c1_seq3:811-2478(+)
MNFSLLVLLCFSASSSVPNSSQPEILTLNELHASSLQPLAFAHFKVSIDTSSSSQLLSYSFLIFQVHSPKYDVTISLQESPDYYKDAVNSTDGGLLVTLLDAVQQQYDLYVFNRRNETQKVDVEVIPYLNDVPIPGGCCKTCDIEIDPNLNVTSNAWYTTVIFQLGNGGFDPHQGVSVHYCSGAGALFSDVTYELYIYSLGSWSMNDNDVLEGWTKMADPATVRKHGHKVGSTLKYQDPKRVTFSSSPGRGVILNVIASSAHGEAAYVPYTSFGCSLTSTDNNCNDAMGSHIVTKILCTVAGLIGLAMCLFGHKLFKFEVFLVGLMYFMFFSYIALSLTTDMDHYVRIGIGFAVGVFGGLLLFAIWWRFYLLMGYALLIGIILGFLFGCILFFTPFGALDVWQTELNFWIAFVCAVLIPVVLLLLWPRTLNIVTTSVVGSYAFVLGVSEFTRGVLVFIVADVIKKAAMPYYTKAYSVYSLEMQDKVLVGVWGFLALFGSALQFYNARKARQMKVPDFPPWPYGEHRKKKRNWRPYIRKGIDDDESQRLLEPAGNS